MNNYTLKHPTSIGREYMVEKFNQAFDMNVTYGFFKNKLDEFKKSYKRWKFLMHKTGITVDPETSMIYASDVWWREQEFGCKLTKSMNRRPPEFWNVMQRCFVLYDVQSQSQHSARQRREQLINEHPIDEESQDDSDADSGDVPQTQVPETQEEEEVYRVTIDVDETFQNSATINQQRGRQYVI
ncbi:uncharacterized protein LOC110226802 [Arabidopsis lyrata subsp. lyrata]|uniref:uncharacterized protein LOC110226802 n=1 Tax=Arabidopsis lyrata subsp. lyrata TaxID=81972 RepID=UPI000A29B6AD|nr:uncharacterized protein LOC110226802 [Arabidopsis lyrata subsp. lyrata]|eukprot:XP_020875171.1 uncharacterized protein LOC110226802 [Arabidopsis lyrata subsp. lyrata]